MIHDRLQELDLRITELSDYFKLSRPTIYKFIDAYDKGNYSIISENVLRLFHYISTHDLIDKRNVMTYLLNELSAQENALSDTPNNDKEVHAFLKENPNSDKASFIRLCVQDKTYDNLLHYLTSIRPLLSKKRLSNEEKHLLEPYSAMLSAIAERKER